MSALCGVSSVSQRENDCSDAGRKQPQLKQSGIHDTGKNVFGNKQIIAGDDDVGEYKIKIEKAGKYFLLHIWVDWNFRF